MSFRSGSRARGFFAGVKPEVHAVACFSLGASLLGSGCLNVDDFTTVDSPEGEQTPDEMSPDAGGGLDEEQHGEGRSWWIQPPSVPEEARARVGWEYWPVPEHEVNLGDSLWNYPYFSNLPCLTGKVELVDLVQRRQAVREANLDASSIPGALGSSGDYLGLKLHPAVARFAEEFGQANPYNLERFRIGLEGPEGVDFGTLRFVESPAPVPTDRACLDGYADSVKVGARFVYAFRFEFSSKGGAAWFAERHSEYPIAVLEEENFSRLHSDAAHADMTDITVGLLQVGGLDDARVFDYDTHCSPDTPSGFANCRIVLEQLRDAGRSFLSLLPEKPTADDLGGYVPIGATLAPRTW